MSSFPPVHAVYQPIVDLRTNDVVAYEALARGPQDSPWATPDALFTEARTRGIEGPLDLRCRAAAMSGALERGLPASIPLFVNAEPRWLDLGWPPHLGHVLERALDRLQIVVVRSVRQIRSASKGLLLPMSHFLERHALGTDQPPVLLATFEDATHFTPATALRYQTLAHRCAFVGALGAGMPSAPVPGVRGADLDPDDPLAGEWVVCTVGPHFAGALIAKDLGDTGPDRERRFDMAITYDRELVLDAARSLFSRIARL